MFWYESVLRHAAVAPPERWRALRLLRLGSNHSVLSSRAAAAALSSTESVQHRERRTAPDPPRKTPQTAAEALQPASSTSTRPTGKIIHRFPSNTRDNSAEITRECVWASNTQQQRRYKLLMWLNAIIFNTFVLLFFTLCLCAWVIKIHSNDVWFEYFPCLSHSSWPSDKSLFSIIIRHVRN